VEGKKKKEEETKLKINGLTCDKMDVRCKTADTNAHPMRNMKVKHEKDTIQFRSSTRAVWPGGLLNWPRDYDLMGTF